jgi:hypothetical protein
MSMVRVEHLRRWFVAPYIKGARAVCFAVLAVAVPTLIRAAVDGVVTGVVLTPYVPFVLLAANFLGWRPAAFVAIVDAVVADAWFIGPANQLLEGATDVFACTCFLVASAMLIAFVHAMRRLVERSSPAAPEPSRLGGIVFSLEDGVAWASWYGKGTPIPLGPDDEVAEMMEDFLAPWEIGRRLTAARQSR